MNQKVEKKASETVIVYTTTADEAEAKRIGKALVDDKLVACVNIIPGIKSICRWDGNVAEANECIMLAKAPKNNVDNVITSIRKLHSYELPCVVVIPIIYGLEGFLDWIIAETI